MAALLLAAAALLVAPPAAAQPSPARLSSWCARLFNATGSEPRCVVCVLSEAAEGGCAWCGASSTCIDRHDREAACASTPVDLDTQDQCPDYTGTAAAPHWKWSIGLPVGSVACALLWTVVAYMRGTKQQNIQEAVRGPERLSPRNTPGRAALASADESRVLLEQHARPQYSCCGAVSQLDDNIRCCLVMPVRTITEHDGDMRIVSTNAYEAVAFAIAMTLAGALLFWISVIVQGAPHYDNRDSYLMIAGPIVAFSGVLASLCGYRSRTVMLHTRSRAIESRATCSVLRIPGDVFACSFDHVRAIELDATVEKRPVSALYHTMIVSTLGRRVPTVTGEPYDAARRTQVRLQDFLARTTA